MNKTPLEPAVIAALWRVKEGKVVTNSGTEVRLRGIAFGNQVLDGVEIPSGHHGGSDFARVKQMGMNTVRFYLNYRTFEDDDLPGEYKESGFAWVDQNIEWARAHGVRLVLNMHVPVGGEQGAGKGGQLWEDSETQERFIELWRAIAERYRAEPQIVGYGILNEPGPTSSIEQWQDLADRAVAGIREMDQHHILFVERAASIGSDLSEAKAKNFISVEDPNVIYEFHFYKPFHFTHQNARGTESSAREGWYPDANVPEVEWYELETAHVATSEKLRVGDSDWSTLETPPYLVEDEAIALAKPVLVCDSSGGAASFDRLSLAKLSKQQVQIRRDAEEAEAKRLKLPKKLRWLSPAQIRAKKEALAAQLEPELIVDLDLDTQRGWLFSSKDGSGKGEFVTEGNDDFTALSISKTKGPATFSSDTLRFVPEQGAEYQLRGIARGKALSQESRCLIQLEFYSSKVPVQRRDRAFLEQELAAYLKWGRDKGFPLYLGEFGTIRDSFLPGRGGEKWVEEMLSLIEENGLHFSYHSYHEDDFGLYTDSLSLPDEDRLNGPLREVFIRGLVEDAQRGDAEKPGTSAGDTKDLQQ